jgi:hypothetical protein
LIRSPPPTLEYFYQSFRSSFLLHSGWGPHVGGTFPKCGDQITPVFFSSFLQRSLWGPHLHCMFCSTG